MKMKCEIKTKLLDHGSREPDYFYELSFTKLTFNQLQFIKKSINTLSTLEQNLVGSGRYKEVSDAIETAIINLK